MTVLVEIDGSMGEGGGQLLRYAAGLSVIMGKPIRIYNIRAKRPNPGLRPQHLTALKTIAEMGAAKVRGLKISSTVVEIYPNRPPRGGQYSIDIGTAGSISLLLQATLPVFTFADEPVFARIRGGTSVKWSPPIPYLQHVLLPLLSKMGVRAEIRLVKRGFYPEGGGVVEVKVFPTDSLRPINIGPHRKVSSIEGISYVGNLPRHIAERQARSAVNFLVSKGVPRDIIEISIDDRTPASGRGSGIVIWANTDVSIVGGDSLGERGKPAEKVGEEAAKKLANCLEYTCGVDSHALDNLVLYMFLSPGSSSVHSSKMTGHALTAAELCKIITGGEYRTVSNRGVKVFVKGVGVRRRA